jgi:uncharacterized protein with HEPN domain
VRSLQSMTQHELKVGGALYDIEQAAARIQEFVHGMALEQYVGDRRTVAAVEREFITVGEALRPLFQLDPSAAERITHARRIIDFRNTLTHGYDRIENDAVWRIIQHQLPQLITEVRMLRESL